MSHVVGSPLVRISEPRKRRMLLIGALGIVVIFITIVTLGTMAAITPNTVSVTAGNRFVDSTTTRPNQMTMSPKKMPVSSKKMTVSPTQMPLSQEQLEVVCRERSINFTKKSLLTYFKNICGHQTISGLHVSNMTTNGCEGLEIIKRKSGKTPIVLSSSMPKYISEMDTWQSYFNKIITNWKDGHLLHLLWGHIGNPLGSMNVLSTRNENSWNDLIKNGGKLNKLWKRLLDILATYLKQLQTARVVPILDILPFINYKYGMWSNRPGLNGSIKLYQITHDYLTIHHGLGELMWTLSLDKNGGLSKLQDYWPGDQYVDVVVIYMWKNKELSSIEYDHILEVANDKPIAMIGLNSIPTLKLISEQPRWSWFTIFEQFLIDSKESKKLKNINATFNDQKVISKEICKTF